jgi:hypothetical protein
MAKDRYSIIATLKVFLLIISVFITTASFDANANTVKTIVDADIKEIGTVIDSYNGQNGNAPIIILDEIHGRPAVQIEQALMFTKMYYENNMRHIVLEAHLKSDPPINTQYFHGLTKKWSDKSADNDLIAKASVATQLLKEGEIGAAEFLALVYQDIVIIPSENLEEYRVDLPGDAGEIPLQYLLKMAIEEEATFEESLVADFKKAEKEYDEIKDSENTNIVEKAWIKYSNLLKEVRRDIFEVDEWILEKYEEIEKNKNFSSMSLNNMVKIAREIKAKAEEDGVNISSEEQKLIDAFIEFYSARDQASYTMLSTAIDVAEGQNGVIGMVVGAGHTIDIVEEFKNQDQTFVAIRPNSVKSKPWLWNDYYKEAYNRKEEGLSLFSEGINKTFVDEFGTANEKKPKPVLMQPWFQAKSEIYLALYKAVEIMLPPNGRGPGGPSGPGGGGKWISMNGGRAIIVPDGKNGKYYCLSESSLNSLKNESVESEILKQLESFENYWTEDKNTFLSWVEEKIGHDRLEKNKTIILKHAEHTGTPSALIPIILNPLDPIKKKKIWVKAIRKESNKPVFPTEREAVEQMLRKALGIAKSSEKMTSNRAEDAQGRLQVTDDIIVSIGSSKESVREVSLI